MKLHWVRNQVAHMRGQISAQEREIRMLQRAGLATASPELLLAGMRAKVDDLCREGQALRAGAPSPDGPSSRRSGWRKRSAETGDHLDGLS